MAQSFFKGLDRWRRRSWTTRVDQDPLLGGSAPGVQGGAAGSAPGVQGGAAGPTALTPRQVWADVHSAAASAAATPRAANGNVPELASTKRLSMTGRRLSMELPRTQNDALMMRRQASLKKPDMSLDELEIRERQKAVAAQEVRRAMERAIEEEPVRPLKRFNCKLVIALHYHHTTKHGKARVDHVNAVMVDNTPWTKFAKWAAVQLDLKEERAAGLAFQYFNDAGRGVRVDRQQHFTDWLDRGWARHPPHMHVYSADSLVAQAEDRAERVAEMFQEYDVDRSGTISPAEMREMLMRLQLGHDIEVSREAYASFVEAELVAADLDKDGVVTYAEFEQYFNQLQDYLKDALTSRSRYEHMCSRVRTVYAQARSYRRVLGEWLDEFRGVITLDAHGHDYEVRVELPPTCGTERNRGGWVRAQTLLDTAVDHFEDATGACGDLLSPIVQVELEAGTELDDFFHVTLPHAFDLSEFNKEDVVVVYGHAGTPYWHEVAAACWDVLPPAEDAKRRYPALRVAMPDEGIVAAYARRGRKVAHRVQCVAFLPAKIIPLEAERLRVWLVPALPDHLELAFQNERIHRGSVVVGGLSKVQSVRRGSSLELMLSQHDAEKHGLLWECQPACLEFEIDPHYLQKELNKGGVLGPDESGGEKRVQLHIAGASLDIGQRMGRYAGGARTKPRHFELPVRVALHTFPAPSPPLAARCTSRTQHVLAIEWSAPLSWGGCALASYEVQLRTQSRQGEFKEWEEAHTGSAQICAAYLHINAWKCEVRVRAFNIGALRPSEWSETLRLGTPEEEEAAKEIQRVERGAAVRRAKAKEGAAAAARDGGGGAGKGKGAAANGVSCEGGMAAVEQQELEVKTEGKLKKRKVGTDMGDGKRWSDFTREIGRFYLEMGVPHGVEGKMFDLTPQNVEALVEAGMKEAADGATGGGSGPASHLDLHKPMMSLAAVAVWVLATLAHHAENSEEWIATMNTIEGLLSLASHHNVVVGSAHNADVAAALRPHVRGILRVLFECYETLRQCEPGTGYVTNHLSFKYDKPTRRQLKEEWATQLERLRREVSVNVMNFILEMRNAAPHAPVVKLEDASTLGKLDFETQVEVKVLGAAETAVIDVVAVEADALPRTREPLYVRFTLPAASSLGDAASGRTLRAPAGARAEWTDGIVTMRPPEGNSYPMLLIAELFVDHRADEFEDDQLLGRAEVVLEAPLGRAHHLPLQADGGPTGAHLSFSYTPSTIVHKDARGAG